MNTYRTLCLSLLLLFLITPAQAQDRFGVELRIGTDFATQDLGNADLNTGFGSEVVASYRFYSDLGVYAGFGYDRASTDGDSFVGDGVDVEETGYTFGLQFVRPRQTANFGYFVRAGGIYNHLELEDGGFSADTDHGFGWQAEAGPVITLGARWHLLPGLRYRSLSRDLTVDGTTYDVDRRYLSVGVGIQRTF